MDYFEEKNLKTDEALCAEYPTLEPEYTRAHAFAEKLLSEFEAEHFKPIIKKLTDAVGEALWDMVQDSLIADTSRNVAGHIQDRIESSIEALLGGKEWAIKKYVLEGYDREGIRAAVAKAVPQEVQTLRIADLEKEVARLKDSLEFHARRY
jgi:hypothetical protein